MQNVQYYIPKFKMKPAPRQVGYYGEDDPDEDDDSESEVSYST